MFAGRTGSQTVGSAGRGLAFATDRPEQRTDVYLTLTMRTFHLRLPSGSKSRKSCLTRSRVRQNRVPMACRVEPPRRIRCISAHRAGFWCPCRCLLRLPLSLPGRRGAPGSPDSSARRSGGAFGFRTRIHLWQCGHRNRTSRDTSKVSMLRLSSNIYSPPRSDRGKGRYTPASRPRRTGDRRDE